MADSSAPAEKMANLHLDEVTGEMVSKSELKKRLKGRQKKEQKKAEAGPAKLPVAKKENSELDETELTANQYFEIRSRNINQVCELGVLSPTQGICSAPNRRL
jgi:lysyl-tRNA synthetase class 2